MNLRYDEDLVEDAVFLCTQGRRAGIAALPISRFNRERERLYRILDPDERNQAFFTLHLAWFREWGLETLLAGVVGEFPLLPDALDVLAFRKAPLQRGEGAELYVNETDRRTGVMALLPERFEDDDRLLIFLRHELTHLQDMIAPSFGYTPEIPRPTHNTAQWRLTRERYRLLWDITIDGRLESQTPAPTTRERHRLALDRAYVFWPEAKRRQVFESPWTHPVPRHAELTALAADPRGLSESAGPVPGAPCPLCGFSTFHWIAPPQITPAITGLVAADFAHWTPDQCLCHRCHEIYELRAKPTSPQHLLPP